VGLLIARIPPYAIQPTRRHRWRARLQKDKAGPPAPPAAAQLSIEPNRDALVMIGGLDRQQKKNAEGLLGLEAGVATRRRRR